MDVWISRNPGSWEIICGNNTYDADVVWLESPAHMTHDGRIHCLHSYADIEEGPKDRVFATIRRGKR